MVVAVPSGAECRALGGVSLPQGRALGSVSLEGL